MEVRAGEGGEDSKMFVSDLASAYVKYSNRLGFSVEIVNSDESSISLKITGASVFVALQSEAGKHCVQRVPPTEKRGRRQTSTVVVIVVSLEISKHSRSNIPASDIQISTMRGSGPGGQHRNKTESAVRAKHTPTGICVKIDGRDQSSNKALALRILEQRVKEYEAEISAATTRDERQKAWNGGNRSDKIRTYNFIESRAVDHRSGNKTRQVVDVISKGRFDLLK